MSATDIIISLILAIGVVWLLGLTVIFGLGFINSLIIPVEKGTVIGRILGSMLLALLTLLPLWGLLTAPDWPWGWVGK